MSVAELAKLGAFKVKSDWIFQFVSVQISLMRNSKNGTARTSCRR